MKSTPILEAIERFIKARKTSFNADLVKLWSSGMETQMNVSGEGGKPIEDKKNWFTDGLNEWGPIHSPKDADRNPHFYDYPAPWPPSEHASDIGMSGWNWRELTSYWVGMDIDDIIKHLGTGVTKEKIEQIKAALWKLDYVMIRRGTSGTESEGLHIYVLLSGIPTENHNVHAVLARAVVAKIAADTGLDIQASIDVCGRILWFFSTRGSEEKRSYECLKQATSMLTEEDLPGWRDSIPVTANEEDVTSSFPVVGKSAEHDRFFEEYQKRGWPFEHRSKYQCYHMHRGGIKETCEALGLPIFSTSSPGTDKTKANCKVYLRRKGFYVICFADTTEGPEWGATAKGEPSLEYSFVARPIITVDADLDRAVDESIKALCGDSNTYQRGALVEVVMDAKKPKHCLAANGAPQLRGILAATLKRKLSACGKYQKWNAQKGGFVSCLPSDPIVNAVLASAAYPGIPVATGIVNCPILRDDGSVAREPGYDPLTGLFLDIRGEYPDLMEVSVAVEMLEDVLVDFPFAGENHRSGWFAALLTMLARAAFAGSSPFFLFDADRSGAGKGLETNMLTMILEGRRAARYDFPKNGEEIRKVVTSVALSGVPYLLFDNIKGKFGGATIENAITAERWSDRLLGLNRHVDLPLNLVWLGTANNATLTGDMVRRTVHIRLETNRERPDLRCDFRHPKLLDYVEKHRRELAIAGLSILVAYMAAGKPKQDLPVWGGFEGWSDLVRSSLVWAGLADPDNRATLAAQADDDTEQLSQLMEGWAELGGIATVGEAIRAANVGIAPTLEALLEELPRDRRNQALGRLLRDYRGRVLGGKKFERTGQKTPRWQLVDVRQATQVIAPLACWADNDADDADDVTEAVA